MAETRIQKNETSYLQHREPRAESERNREERIRERAYQLYESRNFEDGHAEEDWFRAEAEVAEDLGDTSH